MSAVSTVLRVRFPLTDGVSDYLGIEFKNSNGGVHVHLAAYVAKVAKEAGSGVVLLRLPTNPHTRITHTLATRCWQPFYYHYQLAEKDSLPVEN